MDKNEILERSKVVAEMILDQDTDVSDVMEILRAEHYGEEAHLKLQYGPDHSDEIIWGGSKRDDYPVVDVTFSDPMIDGIYPSSYAEERIKNLRYFYNSYKKASKKSKVPLKPLSKLEDFDYGYFCDVTNIFTKAYYGYTITSPFECVKYFKKYLNGELPRWVSHEEVIYLLKTWFMDKTLHLTCADYDWGDTEYTIEFTEEGVSQETNKDYDNYECSWEDINDRCGKYKSFKDSNVIHLLVEMLDHGEKFEKDDIYYSYS